MLKLKTSGKVNGVVLINNRSEERPQYYSHDDTCPNRYSGLARSEQTCNISKPWNPHGTGLMLIDWGFPIFHIEDEDTISKLYEVCSFSVGTKQLLQEKCLCKQCYLRFM